MKSKTPLLSKLYTAAIFVFLYAPILMLVIFSFNSANSTATFAGFSFKWYGELFRDSMTLNALKNTLIIAVLSSLISTILGTGAAVGINAYKSKALRNSVMTVTNIPMMNPEIVTGISMMFLFVFIGRMLKVNYVLGFGTLLIAHITFNLPYVILNVMPKLRQTDVHLSEAAMDLGCTPIKAFFKVVLPAIWPGIVSGLIMAFTLSLDDFIISHFVSGPSYQTLPLRIYSMTKRRVTPDIYALSTLIFVTILLLLLLTNLSQMRADKRANKIVKTMK